MKSAILLAIAIYAYYYYQDQLSNCQYTSYCFYAFVIIGLYQIIQLLMDFLNGFWHYVLQSHIDFRKQYFDQDSWVVVTGATDGLGWGFANFFAEKKFNICLLSRNKQSLEAKAQELEKKYQVKTQVIVADFNTITLSFYQGLYSQLEKLDIAILINNIGGTSADLNYFKEETMNTSYQTIAKNILSTTFLSQYFIPVMLKRNKKSAIVNLGSGLSAIPNLGTATYGACKAYIRQLTETLQLESQSIDNGKIDFLCFSPNLVQSRAVKFKTFVQVPQAVSGAMKALGRRSFTKGHWLHAFQKWSYENIPCASCITDNQMNKTMKKMIEKSKQKQEAGKKE